MTGPSTGVGNDDLPAVDCIAEPHPLVKWMPKCPTTIHEETM
jgi:hypothetical protein